MRVPSVRIGTCYLLNYLTLQVLPKLKVDLIGSKQPVDTDHNFPP